MNNSSKSSDLQQNSVDLSVATGRSVANLVPIVGPFFAEIIGLTIPNQRMDRVAKFVGELEGRLESVERVHLEEQLSSQEFSVLIEEGIRQAASSVSDERRSYIASLIINGLNSEQIEYTESKHLLRILGEINDIEVIWLRFHKVPTIGGDEEFRGRHNDVLELVIPFTNASQETLDKSALQKNYKEHLAQLGLLDRSYRTDMQTRMPEFDSFSGAMEVSGYELTGLGKLLLREIGLGGDPNSQ